MPSKINKDVDFSPERLDEAFGATGKSKHRIETNSGETYITGCFVEHPYEQLCEHIQR